MTIDEIRAKFPGLGLALYAMEPGGPVVLETYADGQVFSFRGPTAQAVLDEAFPPEPPAENVFD